MSSLSWLSRLPESIWLHCLNYINKSFFPSDDVNLRNPVCFLNHYCCKMEFIEIVNDKFLFYFIFDPLTVKRSESLEFCSHYAILKWTKICQLFADRFNSEMPIKYSQHSSNPFPYWGKWYNLPQQDLKSFFQFQILHFVMHSMVNLKFDSTQVQLNSIP